MAVAASAICRARWPRSRPLSGPRAAHVGLGWCGQRSAASSRAWPDPIPVPVKARAAPSSPGARGRRSGALSRAPPPAAQRPPSFAQKPGLAKPLKGPRASSPASSRGRRSALPPAPRPSLVQSASFPGLAFSIANPEKPAPADPLLPEVCLDEFKMSHIELCSTPVTIRDGYTFLCSYNNLIHPVMGSTVLIPGDAPTFCPPSDFPQDLKIRENHIVKRQGGFGLHINHSLFKRMESFPAMEIMRPDFLFDDIDVVIDARALKTIFGFCFGENLTDKKSKNGLPEQIFDLFLAGDKTMFVEWPRFRTDERAYRDVMPPVPDFVPSSHHDKEGFGKFRTALGKAFEKTYTKVRSAYKLSTNHQRYLLYRIGDLNVVVETGVDARYYFSTPPEEVGERDLRHFQISTAEPGSWLHHQKFNYSSAVVMRGVPVRHSDMVEMKLKGQDVLLRTADLIQCWISRVSHLAMGVVPTEGTSLRSINMMRMDQACRQWEELPRVDRSLHRLAGLLAHLRQIVKKSSQRATHPSHRTARVVVDYANFSDPHVKVVLPTSPHETSLGAKFLMRWWESERPGGTEWTRMQQARHELGQGFTTESWDSKELRQSQLAASSLQRPALPSSKPEFDPEIIIDSSGRREDGQRPHGAWTSLHPQTSPQRGVPASQTAIDEAAWRQMHKQAAAASKPRNAEKYNLPFPSFLTRPESTDAVKRRPKRTATAKEDPGKSKSTSPADDTRLKEPITEKIKPSQAAAGTVEWDEAPMVNRGKKASTPEPTETVHQVPEPDPQPTAKSPEGLAARKDGVENDEPTAEVAEPTEATIIVDAVEAKTTEHIEVRVEEKPRTTAEEHIAVKIDDETKAPVEANIEEKAKEEIKDEVKEVKEEFKEEIKEEVKKEVVMAEAEEQSEYDKKPAAVGVKEQVKEEVKEDIKEEVKKEAKEGVKEQAQAEAQEEAQKETQRETQKEAQKEVMAEAEKKSEQDAKKPAEVRAEAKAAIKAEAKPQAKQQAKPLAQAAKAPIFFIPGAKRKPPPPPPKPEPSPKKSGSEPDVPPQSTTGTYYIPDDIPWP